METIEDHSTAQYGSEMLLHLDLLTSHFRAMIVG